MATRIESKRIARYDPRKFHGTAGLAAQGYCTFSRFCNGQAAEFMMSQQARSGTTWVALCRGHAAEKAGGEENLPR